MLFLFGADQCLECETDLGLSLDISIASTHVSRMEADIKFDLGTFIQYYVKAADLSYHDETAYIL